MASGLGPTRNRFWEQFGPQFYHNQRLAAERDPSGAIYQELVRKGIEPPIPHNPLGYQHLLATAGPAAPIPGGTATPAPSPSPTMAPTPMPTAHPPMTPPTMPPRGVNAAEAQSLLASGSPRPLGGGFDAGSGQTADQIHWARQQAFAHQAIDEYKRGKITRLQLIDALQADGHYDYPTWKQENVVHPRAAGPAHNVAPEPPPPPPANVGAFPGGSMALPATERY